MWIIFRREEGSGEGLWLGSLIFVFLVDQSEAVQRTKNNDKCEKYSYKNNIDSKKVTDAFYYKLNLHRPSSKHIAQCSRNSKGMSLARRYSTRSPESSSAC